MSAKKMLGKVIYKANLASNTWLLGIEFEEKIEYIPGQFVSMKVSNEGLRRSYSVTNLPEKNIIDLTVDVSPMGVGSKYILGLRVGDVIEVIGFLGKFTVSEELAASKEMLFVGTGCGAAPLKPMIEDLLINKGFRGQICLVWGMRMETDLYWIKEIDKLQRNFDNFHFEIVLSKPGEDWPGKRGHVGDTVDSLSFNWKETGVFMCGNPEMVAEIKEKLLNKGVNDDKIIFEKYT
jgi:NAD(P)H-flavin reductase